MVTFRLQIYNDLTRKIAFFEEWPSLKFNNLRKALGTNLKLYTGVTKGLKLKAKMFLGLILTSVEVTAEKLVRGAFLSPVLILNKVKQKVTSKDNKEIKSFYL